MPKLALFDQSDPQRELGITIDRFPRGYRRHRRVASLARQLNKSLALIGEPKMIDTSEPGRNYIDPDGREE